MTSKHKGQEGATEEIGAQNVAGPVGAEVYPGDADSQDQEGQERLDGSAKPRPADKNGGQIDEEAKEDEGLVRMSAREAETANLVIEAGQVGGWPGTVNGYLKDGTENHNDQSARGGKALGRPSASSPVLHEQT